MSQVEIPEIYLPHRDELAVQLADDRTVEQRIRYVRDLLREAEQAAAGIANLARDLERKDLTISGMREELKALREKYAPLNGTERAALDARYEMLGQIKKARGRLGVFKRDLHDALREMEEALTKP